MAHQWGNEFDDRRRYGRPQHDASEGMREEELYGRPQHPEADDAERNDASESPMSLRWVPPE